MATFEDYHERVNLHEHQNQFQRHDTLRENLNFYRPWKNTIMNDVYDNDSIFSIEWDFLYEQEKRLYDYNSENYKRKYILLFEIELFRSLFDYVKDNFQKLYPVLWKDESLTKHYMDNLYPKIQWNIELRHIQMDMKRLNQYYQTEFERKRLEHLRGEISAMQRAIEKRFLPMESYMKLFYKTEFKTINSYDIRREIFEYL
jgi:hypothetical protein